MEESGAAVRGEEDRVADAQRLGPAEVALSTATAPEPVHGLGDAAVEVCHAPEARLSTEIGDEGSNFAFGLVTPVDCASSSHRGRRFQLGQEKGSSSEQRVMDMDERKEGSLAPAASAENAALQTCHEVNDRLSNKTIPYPPCSEVVCSKDAGCLYGMFDKTAEGSQFEHVGLTGDGGDCRAVVEVVKETVQDLLAARNGAKCGYEGLSVSMDHGSEQEPRGIGSITFANDELQPNGLVSDIEAVSRPAHIDSVPSIPGSIDLSLDLKAGQFGGMSGDSGTCHGADRAMRNDDFTHDSGDLSDPGKHHLEKLPSGAEGLALITDAVGGSDHLDQGLNACYAAANSSANFISNANDGELRNEKLTALHVFIRRNPKRAVSSRSLNSEKQDQIGKGNSGSRKPKKVDIVSSLHQSTVNMFPNKITKGRSGMNRPPKSFTWGNLERLLDCCPSYGPSTSNSRPICLDKGGSYNRSDQRSQPSIWKSRSSRSSRSKRSSFSEIGHAANELDGQPTLAIVADMGHAASELNEQPTFSIAANTDICLESHRGNIPNLSSDKLINILDSTRKTAESIDSHRTESKCIQSQRERALVSSGKETCAAYVHRECAKLSTSELMDNANGNVMLHVGFSPDSVLELASVTCEGNASASHDVMLHENPTDAGALNDGDPSVLSTSDYEKEHASSLMNLEQHARSTLHEDTRKEEVGPSHGIVENDIEGKARALQKSNSVRKIGIVRKAGCKKKDGSKGVKKNVIGFSKASPCESSKLRPSNDPISPGPPDVGSCFEALTSGSQDLGMHEHGGIQSHSVMHGDKGHAFDSMKSPRHKIKDTNARKKGKVRDPHKKEKGKKKNTSEETSLDHGLLQLPSTERAASDMNEQSDLDPITELPFKNSSAISTNLPGNVACKMDGASVPPLPPRAAWVCCDDCQKWRCIPAELADVIGETNCRWTCKDNGDKTFADCSIPQEKSNAEINAELDLSDASADEADNGGSNSKACKPPSWTLVRSNLFLHRNRRTQSIDESMVCNCKPPQDGRMGCRDGCLNRMLNIECVKRTCPCGEQCSNQKFQRRSYAKLRWFHSGKKGYGLQLQEDVTEGRFLIEYVGEVLDITSYESRQRYYACKGQKHFYFMALNGGEVIDACTKGNLGRFINHSCSPNCCTEKWMVNGEVCIGIFALRSIKKGEELTFDYNYVRVSGAAPQKCFCGTAKCRGYLGGDISIVDTIITQDDTEADHFEQMVVDKDSKELLGPNESDSDGSHPNISEPEFSIQGEDLHDCSAAKVELDLLEGTRGTSLETSEPEHPLEAWSPPEDEDVIRTPVHVSRTFESSLQKFSVHDTQSSDLLRKTANSMEGSKAPNITNGSTLGSDFRGNLVPTFRPAERKNLKQHKNQKRQPSSPIDNEHILGVEGTLNSLLDVDGGISKRKDATKGYLKLLVVTAAEDGSAGGTSKSLRDLSLILEALLKTKSHSVLLDIINKNGLQMLHNILKQSRGIFHRRPIIRKLLKLQRLDAEFNKTFRHSGSTDCSELP
uniref:Histone-lysine N-methyltransferase ASHH2 n=2 Tax=Zea mays TaxID=4577 RepID=A0A804PJV2_MAIZE